MDKIYLIYSNTPNHKVVNFAITLDGAYELINENIKNPIIEDEVERKFAGVASQTFTQELKEKVKATFREAASKTWEQSIKKDEQTIITDTKLPDAVYAVRSDKIVKLYKRVTPVGYVYNGYPDLKLITEYVIEEFSSSLMSEVLKARSQLGGNASVNTNEIQQKINKIKTFVDEMRERGFKPRKFTKKEAKKEEVFEI